ncbi:hypothetical protein FA13DRAFT_846049 [Coprinellus micaceus]|uniref:Uncharacterized protein n=1 Tax=Coprinellus micaceus TaxID=71717 RepID=A0A4Y7T2Y2_COPMI|nr:hypothetical protein FA13DRAFT_846049 [Coprinellus micaceus]
MNIGIERPILCSPAAPLHSPRPKRHTCEYPEPPGKASGSLGSSPLYPRRALPFTGNEAQIPAGTANAVQRPTMH